MRIYVKAVREEGKSNTIKDWWRKDNLDDFYHEKEKENKYNLIKDEPEYMPEEDVFMCMLAGAAHKLANDYGLKIPEWVMKRKYILKNKYYAFDTKNKEFQEYLEKTTPEEYRMRN